MSWRISSCFDCRLLRERAAGGFYCPAYRINLTYDIARTVNDCKRKVPFDDIKTARDKTLDDLYLQCCDYATLVLGPFTARELVAVTQFQNKNSLWQMLEDLVKQGRLLKGKMKIANRYGHIYRSNVYFPVWQQDNPGGTLSSGNQGTSSEESMELCVAGSK